MQWNLSALGLNNISILCLYHDMRLFIVLCFGYLLYCDMAYVLSFPAFKGNITVNRHFMNFCSLSYLVKLMYQYNGRYSYVRRMYKLYINAYFL